MTRIEYAIADKRIGKVISKTFDNVVDAMQAKEGRAYPEDLVVVYRQITYGEWESCNTEELVSGVRYKV
jgi:hypothetical protein